MAIKIASFFTKNYEKLHSGWELSSQTTPRPPSVMGLSYTIVYSAHIPIYTFALFIFGLSPLPIAKSWLRANTQATAFDLPIYNIFVPLKVPLSKISEDVITCDLVPPNQKSWLHLYPWSYMHSCNWLLS